MQQYDKLKSLIDQIDIEKNNEQNFRLAKSRIHLNIDEFKLELENSKKSLFEKTLETISFGIINYNKKYKDIATKKQKVIEKLKLDLIDIDIKIFKLVKYIRDLEEQLNKNLYEFKMSLFKFQVELLSASKCKYIDDYTRLEFLKRLNILIDGKKRLLYRRELAKLVGEIIEFSENSKKWVKRKNKIFIENEKIREKNFFDNIESNPLTDTQIEAVLTNENNNLILAGAGSGKTSVIVAKVCYLIKQKILFPDEILILAYNKNAQEELKERFEKHNVEVTIKTFHSFGLSVIAQSIAQKPDLCFMTESTNNMTKFIKDTIIQLLTSTGQFFEYFLDFVAYFSVPYRDASDFKNLGEYYDYQNSYDLKTLKHEVQFKSEHNNKLLTTLKEETVKSYQELVIANFLTLNGIRYLYEESYKYKTYSVDKRQYKPDFYLPDFDIYIEHFGIDRKNKTAPYIDNEEYLKSMEWKRELHKDKGTILVETYSYEYTENTLLVLLKDKLLRYKVVFRELTKSELLEFLNNSTEDNRFSSLFTQFLTHFKSNMHSMNEFKNRSEESKRTSLFLKLFEYIYSEYIKFQEKNNCIDFDDMIVRALDIIEKGKYKHNFKHVFIDEFQDISTTRSLLIKKMLFFDNISMTAVGDDWQSINRFAGSNIKIIQDFEKIFGVSKSIILDYTFRFNDVVSKIASDFIQMNPSQLKKEIKSIKKQKDGKYSICINWSTGNTMMDLEKILNQIISKEKEKRKSVMILSRYRFMLKESYYVKEKYKTLDFILSTIHGSKGNEADYVIVLNMNGGKYGFPSKIENDPILSIVLPEGDDFKDSEERRLFYVAMTRVKETLFLCSDNYNKSIFIDEIIAKYKSSIYFFNSPEIRLMNCPECKTGILKKQVDSKKKYFYGCSNFPKCKYIQKIFYCPICKNEMVKNISKKIAECTNKECNYKSNLCKKCNGYMVKKESRYGKFLGCSNYPKCKNIEKENSKYVLEDI